MAMPFQKTKVIAAFELCSKGIGRIKGRFSHDLQHMLHRSCGLMGKIGR
jgi:hypothetical protein